MSATYVFDTEAIIAFLYDEPGHDCVGDLLDEVESGEAAGLLSETNASEVYYLVARYEGTAEDEPTPASFRVADRDVRTLSRIGVAVERAEQGVDVIEAPTVAVSEAIWTAVNKRKIAGVAVDTTPTRSLPPKTPSGADLLTFISRP